MSEPRDKVPNPSKRSICIFSALYAPSMGGVEAYSENLACTLADMGHKTTVITMNTHSSEKVEQQRNVTIVRLPSFSALNGRYPMPKLNKEFRTTMRELKNSHPDYVIVNTRFYLLSVLGLSFARELNIAPVLIEHGSAHLTMGNRLIDTAIKAIEHTITLIDKHYQPACYAVSKKASTWLKHFGITSLGELPNAIHANKFAKRASHRDFRAELGLPTEALVVASVGRLVPEKGVLQLAAAAEEIGSICPNIHIVMAGSGPLETRLSRMEIPNLHLVGRTSRSDTAALLMQANIYCLPSRSEGFATTLLEAAACGTPSITTSIGGVEELIPDDRYGTIIDSMNASAIANALLKADSEPKTLENQGKSVQKRVNNSFTWKRTALLALEACEIAQCPNRNNID